MYKKLLPDIGRKKFVVTSIWNLYQYFDVSNTASKIPPLFKTKFIWFRNGDGNSFSNRYSFINETTNIEVDFRYSVYTEIIHS